MMCLLFHVGMETPVGFPSVLISKESGVHLHRILENTSKVEISLSKNKHILYCYSLYFIYVSFTSSSLLLLMY